MKTRINQSYPIMFMCIFSFFCLYLGAIQWLILPVIIPEFHIGQGVMKGAYDAIYFHGLSLDLYEKMLEQGWRVWDIMYQDQSPAGIGAFFYYLITPKPYVLIPFTATMHSLCAVVLLKISRHLTSNNRLSFCVVIPFLVMPSSLIWLSNFHRDSYFILGFFFVVYAHVFFFSRPLYFKNIAKNFLVFCLGLSLMWLARPYTLQIVITLSFILFVGFFLKHCRRYISVFIIVVILSLVVVVGEKEHELEKKTPIAPQVLNNKFNTLAVNRKDFNRLDGQSKIDTDIQFSSARDVILYIPRAAQISFFAPFPNTWFNKGHSFFRQAAVLEMIYIYLSYCLLLIPTVKRLFPIGILPVFVLSFGLLIIQGAVVSNIGTLYRMRYGPVMLLVTLAWSYFFTYRRAIFGKIV